MVILLQSSANNAWILVVLQEQSKFMELVQLPTETKTLESPMQKMECKHFLWLMYRLYHGMDLYFTFNTQSPCASMYIIWYVYV